MYDWAGIDSANSDAPGELSTDNAGQPRVDDLAVPNTGVGIADRGAGELQDPFQLGIATVTPNRGPFPLPVTASVAVTNPWSAQVSYTFNFGDGTPRSPQRRRPRPTPTRQPRRTARTAS
ncbi:MAG TPA: hypothetical protein VFX16_30845 [Pseudonocardiaceae bacterium]|nr:hypothetical protein [Pseudonocardiaceae bacterium]